MKLASYRDGSRDGHLVVVSRDLSSAHYATGIASRLQQVLDDWNFLSPLLQDLYETLNHGKARHAFAFDPKLCMAPLPRAGQWAFAVRDAAAESPAMAIDRAAGNDLSGPRSLWPPGPVAASPELRLAALMDEVEAGAGPSQALEGVRLLMITQSGLAPGQAIGVRALRAWTACSPVAVTPDELGLAWSGGRVSLPVQRRLKGRPATALEGPEGHGASLGEVLAALTQHGPVRAGSLVGSLPWEGAEASQRVPSAADLLTHEMVGLDGLSVFGQLVVGPSETAEPPSAVADASAAADATALSTPDAASAATPETADE